MSSIVMISGHPDLKSSNVNKKIIDKITTVFPQIELRQLDDLYPDGKIDVDTEQRTLLNADIIILQFPFYWYSVPGLLKLWMDNVFTYGFAYGREGNKLSGKKLILSLTIGGPEEAYAPTGYNNFPVNQLLYPLEQTCNLTGMRYMRPVISHGMVYIPGVLNTLEAVLSRAEEHAERLAGAIRMA